jgi:hypothetical protein
MRLLIPFLLSIVFVAGAAYGQPSGSTASGTMALSPDNCGTPDAPKVCPGAKVTQKHHTTHKTPAKSQ